MYIPLAKVLRVVGLPMEDKKRVSPALFLVIGIVLSALLGLLVSQWLVTKPEQYRDTWYWKYSVLFCLPAMGFLFWQVSSKQLFPLLPNIFRFTVQGILLLMSFMIVLALGTGFTLAITVGMFPALAIFFPAVYIWHVATEVDSELDQKNSKIWMQGLVLVGITVFLAAVFELSEPVALFLGSSVWFGYCYFLLKRALRTNGIDIKQIIFGSVDVKESGSLGDESGVKYPGRKP